jgi:hypothetical protein
MNETVLITILLTFLCHVSAYVTPSLARRAVSLTKTKSNMNDNNENQAQIISRRRAIASAQLVASSIWAASIRVNADESVEDGADTFESIAARAAKISATVQVEEKEKVETQNKPVDFRTIYDFSLPVAGRITPMTELIGQENIVGGTDSTTDAMKKDVKVKAILFVNIKQDDPIARKDIPELITLATK